jgi:hypothetical protein
MSDFNHYMHMIDKRKAAEINRDYAASQLEIAKIKERLAEIKSQFQPLNDFEGNYMLNRERMYAAAFYVVNGRLPSA